MNTVLVIVVVVGLAVLAVRYARGRRTVHTEAGPDGRQAEAEAARQAADRAGRARGEAAIGEHIRRTPR